MSSEFNIIEPIKTPYKLNFLDDKQLTNLQEATLNILEKTGVQFPSEKALAIFADHGADVDRDSQVVKISRDLVFKAMTTVPRYFTLGARNPEFDLELQDGVSFFTNDGCGHEVIDFKTGQRRASKLSDVGMMARINDFLSSMSFSWTMVSAQDCGVTSPIHEMDVTWRNNTKHYQSVTMMGEELCRYGVEMATVLRGSLDEVRKRPPISLIVCTIAPLVQDKEAIEGALVLGEAGIPIVIMSMPTMGTTAPATYAGALAMGDAEIISATVLMQLANPGAPVFHSMLHAWADPRTAAYVGYPLDARVRYAPVEMAHHWGMPALGGAFGTESPELQSWQSAAEVATDPLLVSLSGAEIVTGLGLRNTYTLLYPEAIILDTDIYHRARHSLLALDVSPETLAVDIVANIKPGGHFLSQKHTRKHMRTAMKRSILQQLDSVGQYRQPVEYAREKVAWILENHHPEPPSTDVQKEINQILAAADKELKG
ncbi:MAG: trimethylamine methyltransferase family protein [Anaerolineales bacterium]|uniref:Trimethylamine methyltransferase family protein n=1 Tax=Candidatus Desulfolinea nitratireducens TaxID=2841698 RepID=A0A8J6TJ67_9CHLR|nr:trimethylamine methyltransferase family protein [Candidatus Desulfolinea nitratireducens]MBL6960264.1 trimethylamine methyltransferase family protein [Anaerolineales bacterium]